MDLSPKLLTDVQFREQWRGYNPDEVDEFLERVAAGVEELQHRLVEATDRAANAERRLLERSDEDEIRRTLVLAQRTAVASMEEARTEADRLVSETEARCRQLVADAEAQAAKLDADIATRRRVELGDLAEQRATLQMDIEHLRQFLDAERARLADVLRGQLEWVESGYSLAELPTISDVLSTSPPPVAPVEMRAPEPVAPEPVVDVDVEAEPGPEEDTFAAAAAAAADTSFAMDDLRLAREELADALRRAGVERDGGEEEHDAEPLQLEPQLPRPALFDDRSGGPPTAAHDVVAEDRDDGDDAETPEPQWREEADDDPFLAELRRAVVDTEPLGPRDRPHDPAPTGGDIDDEQGGFFRRGRRRT